VVQNYSTFSNKCPSASKKILAKKGVTRAGILQGGKFGEAKDLLIWE